MLGFVRVAKMSGAHTHSQTPSTRGNRKKVLAEATDYLEAGIRLALSETARMRSAEKIERES